MAHARTFFTNLLALCVGILLENYRDSLDFKAGFTIQRSTHTIQKLHIRIQVL